MHNLFLYSQLQIEIRIKDVEQHKEKINQKKFLSLYNQNKLRKLNFQKLQKIIDDIESGKYNNKKTPSEKIRMIVEEDSPVYEMSILST